jgi:hypothetical protein
LRGSVFCQLALQRGRKPALAQRARHALTRTQCLLRRAGRCTILRGLVARNACCGARTGVLYCAALSCVIHVAARGKVSCPQAIPRLHIKARCHGRAVPRMALSDACTARKGCLRKATHKARNRFDRPCRFCRSSHSHAMGAHYAVQRAMSSKIFMAMRRFPRLNAHKYAPNKLPPTTIYQNILYAGGRAC